jgi:hypothetical protein
MEVNPIAGGNRAKSGVTDNLCGASKRGRCAVNQSRGFRAGLHTMYVEAFAGAIAAVLGKGQSGSGGLRRVAKKFPEVNIECFRNAEERGECGLANFAFDERNHREGKAGFFSDLSHGQTKLLAALLERCDDCGMNEVASRDFWHAAEFTGENR